MTLSPAPLDGGEEAELAEVATTDFMENIKSNRLQRLIHSGRLQTTSDPEWAVKTHTH